MYIVQSIHIWERVQDEKKQERQKCPAGTGQTEGKNWGLVWRNRKKISQIIKDYFHLPFFLLIILCTYWTAVVQCQILYLFNDDLVQFSVELSRARTFKETLFGHSTDTGFQTIFITNNNIIN
jgi:hypothetical protein